MKDGEQPKVSPMAISAFKIGLVALGLSALALVSAPPRVFPWHGPFLSGSRIPQLLRQLADPATNSVESALRWRLLMPAIGHALHLNAIGYLMLPYVGIAALLFAVGWYAQRLGGLWVVALALIATSSAFTFATCWIGQMDAFYLLALVVFTFTPSAPLAALCCAAGPWIDERFLLILPVYVLVRYARGDSIRRLTMVVLPVLGYVVIRLAITVFDPSESSIRDQLNLQLPALSRYSPHILAGWWWGFRAGWIVVIAGGIAALRLFPSARGRLLLAGAAGFGLAAVVLLAWDTTRSIAVLAPLIVIGSASRLPYPTVLVNGIAGALVAANFLLPAGYVIGDTLVYISS